jgi:hypothetical protein
MSPVLTSNQHIRQPCTSSNAYLQPQSLLQALLELRSRMESLAVSACVRLKLQGGYWCETTICPWSYADDLTLGCGLGVAGFLKWQEIGRVLS